MSLALLKHALAEDCVGVRIVDTSERRFGAAAALALSLLRATIAIPKSDVVSLHFSDRATIFAAPWFFRLARIFRKPVVFRQFGGSFHRTLASVSKRRRRAILACLSQAQRVMLQTQEMVRAFREWGLENVTWFPTSRRNLGYTGEAHFVSGKRKHLECVFVGHVRQDKGVLIAAQAVRRSVDARLTVFGPLVDVSLEQLKREGVIYGGVLSPETVQAIMTNYDVFLFPTYYHGEGYPGVLVEAALVSLPMIVTYWGPLTEMFSKDEVVFVEPRDVIALQRAIDELYWNRSRLEVLARASKKAGARFDEKLVNREFISACVQIAQNFRGPP